ncbi:MAG: formylmethanofuran dehydrogenase subunit B [Betaproteobacteria bacterium]|nr:formylmethanofuran dehydrogenase subunit B [Betaproteobacteria bacterium]
MSDMVRAREFDNVPCPFCGLLCDDLRVALTKGVATVAAHGCARSRALFAANASDPATALVDDKPADLAAAIGRGAEILRAARRPLLISAGTDVAGMRVLVDLAERCGGIVDHANGDALFRNLRVLQNTGWISTTFTEVRNRADLLVVAGTGISRRFPRFFERCYGDFETLFETGVRELWFLGEVPDDLPATLRQRTESLAVDPARLAEFFSTLLALFAGRALRAQTVAGVPSGKLSELLKRMRSARYGVLTWAAADLAFAHADLAIQSMCELVRALNSETRFSVLPLGGSDGDLTALQVTTWQTGFPVQVNFCGGAPAQDPARHLARQGEVDAMVFVSALDATRTPPAGKIPSIVLGRAGMRAGGCSVFIPVSVPGLHHTGHLYRADNVVAIHLRKLAGSALPSAAQALQRILDAMKEPH